MKKIRVDVPVDVVAEVMLRSARTCCVCMEPRLAVQTHHIDDDPSNSDIENLAVLCLECHNDTLIKGGFGRKLNAPMVRRFRDEWHALVQRRRALLVEAAVQSGTSAFLTAEDDTQADQTLAALPQMLIVARRLAEEGWGGSTVDITTAMADVTGVLLDILDRLSRRYPDGHFEAEPLDYFNRLLAQWAEWHHFLAEPDGVGTGGTIVRIHVSSAVMNEAARMVEDMVAALWSQEDFQGLNAWQLEWRAAQNNQAS